MQRRIAVGLIVLILMVAGGGFALWSYKQNRPYPVWVPLPLNPEISVEKRDAMVKKLQSGLGERENLLKISKDLGLTRKWHLASDEEAAKELGKRLFVQVVEGDEPQGKMPSVNIGVSGKKKEKEVLGEIVMRLMDDVCRVLGINRPPKKGS
jgi:hypothetical protein